MARCFWMLKLRNIPRLSQRQSETQHQNVSKLTPSNTLLFLAGAIWPSQWKHQRFSEPLQNQISHHEPVRQHRMCKAWKFNGSWWVLFTPFTFRWFNSSSRGSEKIFVVQREKILQQARCRWQWRHWFGNSKWSLTAMNQKRIWQLFANHCTWEVSLDLLLAMPAMPVTPADGCGQLLTCCLGQGRRSADLALGINWFRSEEVLVTSGDLKRLEKYGEVTWEYHLDYCWNLKWQRCHRSKMCTSIPSFLYLSEWPGGASHVAPITWWNSTSQVTPIFGAAAWSSPTFSEPHGRGYLWNEQIATRVSSLIQRQLTLYPWHSITFHNYLIPLREFLYFHGDIWGSTSARVKSYQLLKVVSGGRAPGKSSNLASSQLLVIERFHCFGAVRLEKYIFFLYCVDS